MKQSQGDAISELKKIIEKEKQKEISLDEATKAYHFMCMLARIAVDIAIEESRRENLLLQSPKGFH